MDWADEIAYNLISDPIEVYAEDVAAALRKAKADGLRDAANSCSGTHAAALRAVADKIERGEA